MLHILWLALKFIGVLFAVALAVILLVAALILFCPLSYRVKIQKDASWQVWGRASWLFGLVSVTIQKEASGFQKAVRICGVRAAIWKKLFTRKRRPPKKKAEPAEDAPAPDASTAWEGEESPMRVGADRQEAQSSQSVQNKEAEEKKPSPQAPTIKPKGNPIKKLWNAIVEKCRSLRDAFFRFLDAVRNLWRKMNMWKSFMGDVHTGAAFQLTWQQLLRLLRHAGPQKWKGSVTLGFENPAATGQALAALGVAYPIHRGRVQVNPVWDRAVLEGQIFVKGRVFGVILLHMGGKLYFDKNVKYVVNWFRQQEG